MSINHITGGGGGGLGRESTGTMRYSSGSFVDFSRLPITDTSRMAQHCGPTAAVGVVSRDPTFAPWTPTTSPENNRRVHLSLVCPRRVLVMGACFQEGSKCPVPAPTVQILRHSLCVAASHVSPAQLVIAVTFCLWPALCCIVY